MARLAIEKLIERIRVTAIALRSSALASTLVVRASPL